MTTKQTTTAAKEIRRGMSIKGMIMIEQVQGFVPSFNEPTSSFRTQWRNPLENSLSSGIHLPGANG
jgi:hypothetical protein